MPKPHKEWLKHVPTWLAFAAVLVSLLYCLSVDTNPKVLLPSTPGSQGYLRPAGEYQKTAHELLSDSLTSRTKLSFNRQQLMAEMQARYPELAAVDVTLPLVSRRPVVALTPAMPALILSSGNNAYVVDNRGQVLMPVSAANGLDTASLPTIRDDSSIQPAVGKGVLSTAQVSFMLTLLAQLRAAHIGIQSLTLPAVPEELHLKATGSNYIVKFNLLEDARLQAGTYLAVKSKLEGDKVTPAEYIDVRVPERAYYK